MTLADYSSRKRHDMLWAALDTVLRGPEPISTTHDISERLRLHMGFPAGETPMVLTWLKKVAPLVPEASHTGAIVKAYGRYGRRWVWSRRSGLKPKPQIDVSDW